MSESNLTCGFHVREVADVRADECSSSLSAWDSGDLKLGRDATRHGFVLSGRGLSSRSSKGGLL